MIWRLNEGNGEPSVTHRLPLAHLSAERTTGAHRHGSPVTERGKVMAEHRGKKASPDDLVVFWLSEQHGLKPLSKQ